MQLTFLEASVPLTKNYELRPDGTYVGGAYPGVTNFTSHVKDVETIAQFASTLVDHATAGHCLLTNSLTKQITNEPRRELSDKTERRTWILLDIDGIDGVTSIEEFIHRMLPQPFHDCSYVVQYSPSHGIKDGIRAHLFFMLYDPIDVRAIESWLAETNLVTDSLSNQVTLSNSGLALNYPLDRVASRNGRIVYITPPTCVGFEDPLTDRITSVSKKQDRLSFNFTARTPAEISRLVRDRVNTLRDIVGLKVSKKEEHYRTRPDGVEIIVDDLVEPGLVTSWKEDNDRFMRCNLNGGDSYAYYFHRDQEDPYIHNFKGEPSFRLRLFDGQFYADHVQPHFNELQKTRPRPFVFRDVVTDKWFVGQRQDTQVLEQPHAIGSEKKIDDYFTQYGTSPPAVIPSWEREFNPALAEQWNENERLFNTWRPTDYQRSTLYTSAIPTTIDKVLRHVTGSDEESYAHFINWLAFIQQNRTKPGTAWVLHGIPGTGKGILFHYIIRPIFGPDYCVTKQLRDLTDRFNGWMEQCLFANIDETNTSDIGHDSADTINAIKNWITEPTISVRHMQATAVNRPSFINFIFTTNDFGGLPIQDGDRRINVAVRQEERIVISDDEIQDIKDELHQFSAYLNRYTVDEAMARTCLENDAKLALKEAAQSSIAEFFHAIMDGNIRFFMDGLNEETNEYGEMTTFRAAVEGWVSDAKEGLTSTVKVNELKAAHVVMCRDKGMKSGAFTSMASKRGLPPKRIREDEERIRGWKVDWKLSEEDKVHLKIHLSAVPTPEELEEKIKAEIDE